MAGITQETASNTIVPFALLFEQAKTAKTTTGTLNISMNAATSGTLGVTQYTMPYAGSVFAVSARAVPVATAGTLTLKPVINGTLVDVSVNNVNAAGTLTSSLYATGDARRDNSRFKAGDSIGLVYVTDSNVAPDASIDIVAQVWVMLEEIRV